MNRQFQSPTNMCCCGRSEHNYGPINRHIPPRDSPSEEENYYPKYDAPRNVHLYRDDQHYDPRTPNDQSFNNFSSERQKPYQYSKSEIEETSAANTFCHPSTRGSESRYGNASLLRRANDLIDYAPQSEFLKKMKQQCELLQNCQPNIFSTLNDFVENETPVYECQKCSEEQNSSKRAEQINSDRSNYCTENVWKCDCNQASNVMHSNDDRAFFKNYANAQRQYRENKTEEFIEKEAKETSKSNKKKSEHVSRSKKPEKCRGRRKRKSDSSEKCESENRFEPTLKKPHENSCERCWRFASPARSPVNKPDQKYNPNFRRGRSYMDLEKGSGDLVEKNLEFEKVRTSFVKDRASSLSPPGRAPQQSQVKSTATSQLAKEKPPYVQTPMYNSTKVKELLNPACLLQKPQEKYLSTSQPKDDVQKSKIGAPECHKILRSDSKERLRPKNYNLGLPPPEMGRCANFINDLDLTDYKNICIKPKQQCFDTSDSTHRRKSPPNLTPLSYKETCVLGGHGTSGSSDQNNLKSISESLSKKDKHQNSKSNLSKTSKNLEEFENRTLKTDSTQAQGESSLDKSGKPGSPNKKTREGGKSESSKIKGNQKSDAAKSKNAKSEKKPEKKTEKKTEKKPEKKTEKKPLKKSSQAHKSQTGSDKNRSSKDNGDGVYGSDKRKSQSAGDSLMKECNFNPAPNCGNTFEHNRSTHPIRDCSCYPRVPRSRNDSDNQGGHIFCCHCDWEQNQNDLTNQGGNPGKTSAPARPVCEENERFYRESNSESIDRRFMNNSELRSQDCCHTYTSTFPESNLTQSPRAGGATLSCPYREYYNNRTPENTRRQMWESEYQTRDNRYVPGNQDFYPECSPRKYFMFYMTKSNEYKKGNDVEVLVEELAHACPNGKDMRTKDIAEKMKKIMECPSDSMALRFQKGISEKCKTPPSSRVLYF